MFNLTSNVYKRKIWFKLIHKDLNQKGTYWLIQMENKVRQAFGLVCFSDFRNITKACFNFLLSIFLSGVNPKAGISLWLKNNHKCFSDLTVSLSREPPKRVRNLFFSRAFCLCDLTWSIMIWDLGKGLY